MYLYILTLQKQKKLSYYNEDYDESDLFKVVTNEDQLKRLVIEYLDNSELQIKDIIIIHTSDHDVKELKIDLFENKLRLIQK